LFLVALVPCLAPAPRAAAQAADDNTKQIAFKTYDEVTIQGTLYKSNKGGNSPVVMMLHAFGEDSNKGDFRGLANKLSTEHGFHVLRFDFRGHGQSKLVANKFWDDPINKAYLPRALVKKAPDKIDLNDLKAAKNGYYPRLADDILAARIALDQLNDNNEVNTSSVYLLGAKDAVTNGFLYISAEWARPQKLPPVMVQRFPPLPPARSPQSVLGPGDAAAGLDIAGCIWLSPTRNLQVPPNTIQQWVQNAPDMRERTPMLFLYGDGDAAAKRDAKFFRDEVLAAKVVGAPLPKLQLTRSMAIEKTNLAGANLLGKQLGTEKLIVDYLEALEKERRNLIRVPNRGYATSPGINLPLFGVCKFQ